MQAPDGSHTVDFVVLFNEQADRYKAFPYKLPYKLTFKLRSEDVVKRFGDTKDKGGGSVPIWVKYEHLGVEVQFRGKDWNDAANPIDHIKFFKATKDQTECSLCLKPLLGTQKLPCLYGCSLRFCSEKCWNVFKPPVHECPK